MRKPKFSSPFDGEPRFGLTVLLEKFFAYMGLRFAMDERAANGALLLLLPLRRSGYC